MRITSLKDMYLADLTELANAEIMLVDALDRMAAKASHEGLRDALVHHREVTQHQVLRIKDVIAGHNLEPDLHTDQAMVSLIGEADKMLDIVASDALRDAGIIDSAQRIEHYEIAAYGTVAAYAGILGLIQDQAALHLTLDEEKASDVKLTLLARTIVNADALKAA